MTNFRAYVGGGGMQGPGGTFSRDRVLAGSLFLLSFHPTGPALKGTISVTLY